MLSWKRTNFNVLVAPVDEPLINLITEAQSVMFDTKVCDHLQLISGENLQGKNKLLKPRSFKFTFLKRNRATDMVLLTFPMGLLGLLMMMAFVLELNLLESSSGSRTQSALLMSFFFPDF